VRSFVIKNGHCSLSASPPLFLLQIKEKEIEKKDKSMLLSAFLCAGKIFFVEAWKKNGRQPYKNRSKIRINVIK